MSMFIDSLVLSRDESFHPERGALWEVIHQAEVPIHDASTASASIAGLEAGLYRWRVELRDGDRLVDPLGNPGLWTPYRELRVEP